ncbi:MAG: DNA gyrase inhibitor YacG [bacterium]|nr:DNA gyrase inhibitor YacG [bacterium]
MPADSPEDAGKVSGKRCLECGKPADPATLPFCSKRCRDVDLNRWLSGTYVIPGRPTDPEDAE